MVTNLVARKAEVTLPPARNAKKKAKWEKGSWIEAPGMSKSWGMGGILEQEDFSQFLDAFSPVP